MKKLLMTVAALFGAVQAWGVDCSTWSAVRSALGNGNSVRLTQNMTVDATNCRIAKNVTLDLNGKTVKINKDHRAFIVDPGGTLTITGNGTFTRGTGDWYGYGGGFALVSGGKLVLQNGTISNLDAGNGNNEYGGAVWVNSSGELVMNGGKIYNCSSSISSGAKDGRGGAVYVESGTFTMNGGTIDTCSAKYGGGVYVKGSTSGYFYWYGGVIKSCSASSLGCAVFCNTSGYATLYGGVILPINSNNLSSYVQTASGYEVKGLSSMSVIGKSVSASGDKLRGGTYYFNPTDSLYSNVGLGIDSYCTVTGSAGAYTVNAPYTVTVQAVNGANVSVSGSGQTGSAAGSYLVPKGGSITATYSAKSGYVMVGGVTSSSLSNVQANQTLSTSGISTIAVSSTTPSSCSTWDQVRAVLGAGYDVKLVSDFDFPNTGSDNGGNVAAGTHTLDMNGHTITAQGSYRFFHLNNGSLKITGTGTFNGNGKTFVSDGHFAYVPTGKTLTIDGDVTIKNMKTTTGRNGGAIYVAGGALVMNAGMIKDCTSQQQGGGVFVNAGSFTMSGGMITNCTAATTCNGGGVYVNSGSTMTMTGGTISGCSAGAAGAIFCCGTTTMSGGTISGCSATVGGGAIGIYKSTFTMNGGVLTGNMVSNSTASASAIIYNGEGTATVNGGVSDNSHIGDFKASGKSCTQVGSKYIVGTDIAFDADKKLTAGTYMFCPTNAEYVAAGVAVKEGKFIVREASTTPAGYQISDSPYVMVSTWAQLKVNLEAGNSVKLAANMDADSYVGISSAYDLTIDMNGKIVTRTASTRLFNYEEATIRLKDSVGGGKISAGTVSWPYRGAFALLNENATFVLDGNVTIDGFNAGGSSNEGTGGAFAVDSGASLVINNGTIRGCSANTSGGAVYLKSGATFTMNGGTITNCTGSLTAGYGGAVYNAGTVTMNDGTISGCKAYEGAALYNVGTVTMNGGTMCGNYAKSIGSAIRSRVNSTLTITGGQIVNNSAENMGAVSVDGTLSGSSTAIVSISGGVMRGNSSTATGTDPYNRNISICNATLTITGGVFDSEPSVKNVRYQTYGTVTVDSYSKVGDNWVVGKSIVSDANNQLTAGTYTFNPTNAEYVAAGVVDASKVAATGSGTSYTLKATGAVDCSDWAQLKANLEAGNDVKLVDDFDFPNTGSDNGAGVAAGTHTLDMNGCTITAQGSYRFFLLNGNLKIIGTGTFNGNGQTFVSDGHFAYVPTGKTLTIDGDVTIKNMKTPSGRNGGAIYVAGGALVMNAGTISSATSQNHGGGVYVNAGSFTMNGGMITNCTATVLGGAVYNDGTVEINGGTISGCSADSKGGAVCNGGTFTMNEGTISGCKAKWYGGAIEITAGAVTINGGTISGNSATGDAAAIVNMDGGTVTIRGGVYTNNSSGRKLCNYSGTLYLNGGVFDFSPSTSAYTPSAIQWGDYSATQVGDNYVVGKSVAFDSDKNLTAGTYTFNPTNAEYVAAGVEVKEGKFINAATAVTPKTWTISDYETKADPSSTYKPTQIVNGSFDKEPWMTYTYNGTTYTNCLWTGSGSGGTWDVSNKIFNPVDGGWNTTETKAWRYNLFEYVMEGHSTLDYNPTIPNTDGFVEMNCFHAALLYQDLTTYGGDVIRWSLKHGCRMATDADEVQTMRAEIGAPLRDAGGNIINATGIGNDIDPKMIAETKAIYRNTGVTDASGNPSTIGFAGSDIENLYLTKTKNGTGWWKASGVYLVPEGQSVSRFGFISEAAKPEAGNLLDDLTFSTLIGNLRALLNDDGSVTITGYWGDSDTSKKLMVKIGSGSGTAEAIDMSAVLNTNFTIKVPSVKIGSANQLEVYHQDYESAKRTVKIGWAVTLNLNAADATCAKLTEYQRGVETVLPIPTRKRYAFDGWFTNSVLTGDAVTSIPADATGAKEFWAKWSDARIKVGDDAWAYVENGTCEITGTGLVTDAAALKAAGVTNLVVASGITGIGANVFDGWESIRDVSLGADCTNIASQAFVYCGNLTNVSCAATASMTIGNHAFYRCNSLESMSFGAVPTFGEQAYTLQSGIYIKDGMPEIYPIPQISAPGYRLALMGSVDLQSWTEIKTEAEKLDYNFFKLKLEPSGK